MTESSPETRESLSALEPFLTVHPEGLRAEAFGAVLEPSAPVARAIVTHAHADHAVEGHGEIWATPETLALYRRRHPDWTGAERALVYGEEHEENGVRIRMVPAGHILGSAQILFSAAGQTLLYTGDFKRRAARTTVAAEAPRAGVLVTETTFGLPVFRFPPAAELEARLLAACLAAIAAGETPVLLAYSLGKAQEAAAILTEAGIPSVLHGAAWKLVPEFVAAGVSLPLSRPYESGPPAAGEALITPPSTARAEMVRRIKRRRVLYLSGWAVRDAARAEFDADVLIPMSDHADFDDLRQHVRDVAPRRVVTIHGFAAEFARILEAGGVPAGPLADRQERPTADA